MHSPFLIRVARDCQNNSHFKNLQNDRGSSRREKRQSDTRIGHGIGHHRDIQYGLQRDLDGEAVNNNRTKSVRCFGRNAEAAPDKKSEQRHHANGTDKAQFLTNNGKNKVVLRLGNVAVFLLAVAESLAEKPTRANGIEPLQSLPCRAQRINLINENPCGHTGLGIARKQQNDQHSGKADAHDPQKIFFLGTAEIHGGQPQKPNDNNTR